MGLTGTLRSLPRRLRDSVEQEGALRLSLRTALSPVYRAAVLRWENIYPNAEVAVEVHQRPATRDDVEVMLALRPQYSAGAVRSRLRSGDQCFLSFMADELVSWRWVSTGRATIRDLGLVLPLREEEVYVSEVYTFPSYRRSGVQRASRLAFDRRCDQVGVRMKVSAATPGRKPFGRGDPWRVATVRTLRLGPLRKFWVKTYGPKAEYWQERLKELRWA